MHTWRASLLGAAMLAACVQPRTEIVVSVDSEIDWGVGRALQSVVVSVRRGGASGALRDQRTTALGLDSGRRPLPVLIGVTPDAASDDVDTPLWIEALGCALATGCDATTAVVAQRAVVRFQRDRTLGLPLLLASACRGASCDATQRCEVTTGACRPAAEAAAALVPYDPSAPISDGGSRTDRAVFIDAATDVATDSTIDSAIDSTTDVVVPTIDASDASRSDLGSGSDLGIDAVDVTTPADATADVREEADAALNDVGTNVPDISSMSEVGTDAPDAGVATDGGTVPSDAVGRDVIPADSPSPSPPRPTSPLSSSIVTSQRPTLRWSLGAAWDGARVEICRDRACTLPEYSFNVVGTSAQPSGALARGPHFWRLTGRSGATVGASVSSTWEFFVGVRSAPADRTSGSVSDFNGDGLADVVIGAWGLGGAAYLHYGSSAGLTTDPSLTLNSPLTNVSFGQKVANAGDVNGDGYTDLLVGAPELALGGTGPGRVFIYLGGASGVVTTPSRVLLGPDGARSEFGLALAGAGDVNGDGFADVVVGARQVTSSTGRAYVYLGSATGLAETPATTLTGPDGPSSIFGYSVAGVGDVNGDGLSDIVIGAPGAMSYAGRAYLHLGSTGGVSPTSALTFSNPDGGSGFFGYPVAGAGDVNGDGLPDLLIGASGAGAGGRRAFVYLGAAPGLGGAPSARVISPATTEDSFASSAAGLGDVNADGYDDIVLGTTGGMPYPERAYVYRGSSSGLVTSSPTTLIGPDGANGNFGCAVAGPGDVNGDGFSDLMVGAEAVMTFRGRAYLYRGGVGGIIAAVAVTMTGPMGTSGRAAHFGDTIASAWASGPSSRLRLATPSPARARFSPTAIASL